MTEMVPSSQGENPQDAYMQEVAALAAENWSPRRIVGEYRLARGHQVTGEVRHREFGPLVEERQVALEALEAATGILRTTPETAAEIQKKRRQGTLTAEELSVDNASRDLGTAELVAMSAKARAETAAKRAQLIADAYPAIIAAMSETAQGTE